MRQGRANHCRSAHKPRPTRNPVAPLAPQPICSNVPIARRHYNPAVHLIAIPCITDRAASPPSRPLPSGGCPRPCMHVQLHAWTSPGNTNLPRPHISMGTKCSDPPRMHARQQTLGRSMVTPCGICAPQPPSVDSIRQPHTCIHACGTTPQQQHHPFTPPCRSRRRERSRPRPRPFPLLPFTSGLGAAAGS